MKTVFSFAAIIFFFFTILPGQEEAFNPFEVPENIKDNVAFWKKIYTEISLTEGLIHDGDYPMVIYEKITIGGLKGRQRSRLIQKHIKPIIHSLDIINHKPQSLWTEKEKQVAALFKQYGGMKEIKIARKRIRFQQGQKERFKLGIERSGAYLDFIRQVFKKNGIPERIVYLPHVESSFNINAYSKVGAAGMWQFMRSTGRLFLKIDYKVDERWDPFKSTVAAALLLKKNYEELKSWPLAITAYNHGLVSMKRAVQVTGTRDIGVIIEKYKNRKFRFASKNFYSCFLAASEIGENPQTYFPVLNYQQPIKYNEVVLDSYIRPAVLCKHLGISQKELAQLNPSLRSTLFHRQISIPRGFSLRVPPSISSETALEKIAAIPGSLKSSKSSDYLYYSVKPGDTLFRIARRFRVSTSTLLAANNIQRKNRIYIGQVLRIPGESISSVSTQPKKSIEPETTTPKPAVKIIKKITPPSPKPPRIEMQTAETLPELDAFDATLYNFDVTFFPEKGIARIRVEVEETLGHYADWLGISTSRIRQLNRSWRGTIKVNQTIWIPAGADSLEPFKAKRLEYHMALEEDFYSQYQVVSVKVRRVTYGENLWSICNDEKEIPLWLFKKYNRDLNIEKIRINTKIRLPIIKSK